MDSTLALDLSLSHWFLAGFAAFCIGLAKAGLRGIDVANVTLLAFVFGSKNSTGVILPLLCMADIMAVSYYNRHADWGHFKKLLPWMITGVLLGVLVGRDIDEAFFKKIMAVIISAAIIIMIWWERQKNINLPRGNWFAILMGLIAGVTTMLGNLAGAFSNIYFMVLRFPKNEFIGTVSWLFLFINLFKVPFQVITWNNIHGKSLTYDLYLAPAVILGFFVGVKAVKKLNNENFGRVILYLTLLGAVVLFFK